MWIKRLASALLLAGALTLSARDPQQTNPCTPPNFPLPQFQSATFNVRDFGAKGDGKTNETGAINKTIDQCSASGGGDVVFPAGTYVAASIHLKSNVRFVLDKDAAITGAKSGYDPPEPNQFDTYQDFGHSHFHNALMWGESIENFGIVGGRVNGGNIIESDDPQGRDIGDKVISIKSSRNLLFENIAHETGGHFVYLLNDCENVTIKGVTIKKSRDAVNLVGCRNVQLHQCNFTGCGDDTVALKSDWALGRRITSENIYVWDSYFETACNALQFGAETTGDFRNINFWNIRIGRALKAAIGITSANGGVIDGVNYRDISIKASACPIFMRVTNQSRSGDSQQKIGAIKNVRIANVSATDCQIPKRGSIRTSAILGRPESYLENISIENVRIAYKGDGKGKGFVAPSLKEKPGKPALETLPAAGLYVRHVKGLSLKNIEFAFETPESRPAVIGYDVKDFLLNNFQSQKTGAGELLLERIENLTVHNSPGLTERALETVETLKE